MTLSIAERNALVIQNLGLVQGLAREFATRFPWLDRDELVQEGTFGAMTAAERFEPERGLKFSTFAVPHIRGSMFRWRDRDRVLSGTSSGERKDPEIERLRRRAKRTLVSLNRPNPRMAFMARDGEAAKLDRIHRLKSDLPDPEALFSAAERAHHAQRLIASLRPMDADILRRRLEGESGETIGADHGITRQAVEQRGSRAIRNLKEDPWVQKTLATGGP